MMKKSVYDALNGYSLKDYVLRCEDVDLWIRFFAKGFRGASLQETLYYVREDLEASKRRDLKNATNASKTLFYGFKENGYPSKQYLYVVKPIISVMVPQKIKYAINQRRWRGPHNKYKAM
jgi:glycosyltransferase EpsE